MVFLAEFTVMTPDPGLIFWTTLIFATLFFLLSKYAFKPIAEALKTRENSIADALASAENARKAMANLKSENEALLAQAREERSHILREAKETKDSIIAEARVKAREEAQKIQTGALAEIENHKRAAIQDIKTQSAQIALEIAEKLLRKELQSNEENVRLVNSLVNDMKLN